MPGKEAPAPPETGELAVSSAPLAGVTVAIDPGHGGYDQGCKGARGTLEAPLNLAVSLLVRDRLLEMGASVVLTREEDASLVDPSYSGNRKRRDMELRRDAIQGGGAQILLSIHMNAHTGSSASGAVVYFADGSKDGEVLGDAIQGAFHAANARFRKRAVIGDYFILSCCEASVLIECGFLSNPREEALLGSEEYRGRIAEQIAQGVLMYWHPL
jgi:N-acetylmuramoyl-L-alanine amidase